MLIRTAAEHQIDVTPIWNAGPRRRLPLALQQLAYFAGPPRGTPSHMGIRAELTLVPLTESRAKFKPNLLVVRRHHHHAKAELR